VGDVDGDGCPDSAQIDAGGLVTVGSARYEVGAPGDVIAIGDWDCDGQSTPAVLRPATGEVFIFAAWATRGTDVEAAAATNVAGGVDLTEQTDDAGCSILVVSTSDGRDIEVPT
jgi:co-chaperonin GroES (HSP10)